MGELSVVTGGDWVSAQQKFAPNAGDLRRYGSYELENPVLLAKPKDVPDNYVAYNPSAIWKVHERSGAAYDILYARVEPDRSDSESSHLGRSVVRPYMLNLRNTDKQLSAYSGAQEYTGEDAALTRIRRRLPISGILEDVWLLSYVDPKPKIDRPNEVATLCTRFLAGSDLAKLEHIADGPEWMKDIRLAQAGDPLGTKVVRYGRPQTKPDSGNITQATLPEIIKLTPDTIADAPYVDEDLLPVGSGVWGGVNDIIRIGATEYILAAHRAWRTGPDGHGRHYETVLYGHDIATNCIIEIGVLATADMFAGGCVKDDASVNLSDVVFTGGGYNGGLRCMTFGVSDANIGIAALRRTNKPKLRVTPENRRFETK